MKLKKLIKKNIFFSRKEPVHLHGLMAENMLGSIKMIKNKDMEFLNGLIKENIKVIGKMENSTEKE